MDRWHQTALGEAIKKNWLEIAGTLRLYGAIMIEKSIGYKLCLLASEGKLEDLRTIAMQGKNLTIGDYDGRTAIHLAASNGHKKIVEFLISHGINL